MRKVFVEQDVFNDIMQACGGSFHCVRGGLYIYQRNNRWVGDVSYIAGSPLHRVANYLFKAYASRG